MSNISQNRRKGWHNSVMSWDLANPNDLGSGGVAPVIIDDFGNPFSVVPPDPPPY